MNCSSNQFHESNSSTTPGRPRSFGSAVLPLSPGGVEALGKVRAALADASARRAALEEAALPAAVMQALRVLDDPDYRCASAELRSLKGSLGLAEAVRERRRALFRILRARFPAAFAAFKVERDLRGNRHTAFFLVNVAAGPALDRSFEDLDALD